MENLRLITRIHVLAAIAAHDERGGEAFREDLGIVGTSQELVIERGKRYDPRALLAYAHGRATGEPLAAHRVPLDATERLRGLGFRTAFLEDLDRPAPAPRTRTPGTPRSSSRAAAPSARAARTAKPEPVVAACPTCFMQLPATGRCDTCA